MGFFKKLFKGVKKVFKRIGKRIKKIVKGIGKFMNKIGIVGQIALSFLLPGIGSAIGAMAGSMMASTATGVIGAAVRGAGTVLNAAVNIGSKVGGVVKSVSQGVSKVVGNIAGAALNKIPGMSKVVQNITSKLGMKGGAGIDISGKTFQGAWQSAQSAITDVASAGRDLFSMDTLRSPNKFIKPETLDKLDAAKNTVSEVPTTDDILQDVQQGPQPSKDLVTEFEQGPQLDAGKIDPNKPIYETGQFTDTPDYQYAMEGATPVDTVATDSLRKPQISITDETQGALYRVEETAPKSLLESPAIEMEPIKIEVVPPTPTVTTDFKPEISLGQVEKQPSLFQRGISTAKDKIKQKVSSSLSSENVLKAVKETLGGTGKVGDIDQSYGIDVPDISPIRVAGAPNMITVATQPVAVDGLGYNPNYIPTSNYSRRLAEFVA
tara:strand:+ start:1097 stop:2404 length:1308 start_codon:yes stop_codon:yes gene_type:complete